MIEYEVVPLKTLVKRVKVGFVGTIDDFYCDEKDGVRLIRTLNLTGNGLDYSDIKYVTNEFHKKNKKSQLKKGNLLIARHGDNGKADIFDDDFEAQALNVVIIEQDENIMSSKLLQLYFNMPFVQAQIANAASGSVQGVVNTSQIAELKIPVFKNVDYDKVVLIIDSLNQKITLNNSICSDLESMAKLLYDYWFVQFDFPDENGRPYKSSGGKMVWNDEVKREIPEGWGILDLNEHLKTIRGISYSTPDLNDNGVPMINLACFSVNSNYNHAGLKRFGGNYSNDKVLKPYELVMCNTQQTVLDPTKDIIGKCLIVPDIFDGDILSSHHVNRLLFDDEDLKFYFYGESKTVWFHKFVSGLCSGTNILGMDFNGLYRYKMTMPPVHLLKQYSKMVVEIETKKSNIIEENQELTSLRDFLLPMLMNGQIKIKDAKAS